MNEAEQKDNKIYTEILSHFRCAACGKWWSVSGAEESQTAWHCPHCGLRQEFDRVVQ